MSEADSLRERVAGSVCLNGGMTLIFDRRGMVVGMTTFAPSYSFLQIYAILMKNPRLAKRQFGAESVVRAILKIINVI